MDIGVPYRDLGPVDVAAAVAHVAGLDEDAWTANSFRQDILADGVHDATRAILFRHEWMRWTNPWRVNTMEDLIGKWAEAKGLDPTPFMPVAREETDMGPFYTFREWHDHEAMLGPVVEQALDKVRSERGVVTRLALVRMTPGATIAPHVDGQPMAAKAHRLHVPLLAPPGVEYKIGGKKFKMRRGRVYDFNNRLRYSVRHRGKLPRVNLFIDYYPDPGLYVPPAYGHH